MIRSHIHGHLIGTIWMPAMKCTKPVSIDLTRERDRLTPARGGSLRHLVVRACADGDFQSAKFTADSVLVVEAVKRKGNRRVTRERVIPLNEIESIADCVSDEYPDSGED